jgi:DNA (cytosine-5)-methyltransferase 1
MLHLGDITKINGADVPMVNVIIGGSPCQDLSVAGKRAGLSGERSGLFIEQLRIIKEMRRKDIDNGAVAPRPRYMVWENVPGAFSSNKGEDFRIVLEETAKVVEPTAAIPRPDKGKWTNAGAVMGDGWSIAWRVFDAQFWGVPQRRRRIALVADFGGRTAPEILFERKGVSRYSPPGETSWENFAAAVAERFGKSNKSASIGNDLAYCIQGNCIDRADTAGCNA